VSARSTLKYLHARRPLQPPGAHVDPRADVAHVSAGCCAGREGKGAARTWLAATPRAAMRAASHVPCPAAACGAPAPHRCCAVVASCGARQGVPRSHGCAGREDEGGARGRPRIRRGASEGTYLSCPSAQLPIELSRFLAIRPSNLAIYLSPCLSIHASVSPSTHLPPSLPLCTPI
jgi:hypothetical protein